ncbi:GntR family transcriptional regulator [Kibdelosporangium phytohabitans]|uniref:GntR family transcriptional regulator n=1 Tax=Kibdelosporangium phytohabitans TaxID=860235 RepID=A0A0N9HYU0_9PSEU|nr:GntR family transcriptional regulator [Kibdelosporangium phytohabitans]ALG12520.1 GntR family transcriptional regulator [Kibdelosporangium phytohabitans]MBE1464123.1 DNA-binding GntR family transcriptional regulator [Kibdelosporangium phytohabitans]
MTSPRRRSERQPLADKMYEVLLGQFTDGRWTAGEPVNIGALSRELDVSQTPLREALARLEHTGLVRREALKGYRVAPLLTEFELTKLMDARAVLEPAMAYEAARRTTPEFLDAVLDAVDTLATLDSAVFSDYWKADERFHLLIAKQADNPFLETAYKSLGGQVQRFRFFATLGSARGAPGLAAEEHRAVHAALVAGDPDEASAKMRLHIENAKARVLSDRAAVASSLSR